MLKAPPASVSYSEVIDSEPLHDSSAAVIVTTVGPSSLPDAVNDSVQVNICWALVCHANNEKTQNKVSNNFFIVFGFEVCF